ncbi:hypothetical protein QBC46DRAFT_23637 [Diplogelasinospora grovesii]|uniref:Succinate dehydrogenase assembly factor 4, mitochondrial n=1 Tax=Diplogelasinospora grovesii TaxID=303347 RepID=A0AAN6N1C2_9PEZI|nr:hypothetical protein QBC46DRAFT_23637 [Diplogelasinospora grovesii]
MSRRLPTTFRRPLQHITTRHLSTSMRVYSNPFSLKDQPAPPRLPAEQQAEFERLQRAAEAALHSHTQIPPAAASPASSPLATSRHVSSPTDTNTASVQAASTVSGDGGGSLSGGIRKGAPPEFEGDKNPKTGEVGGPKNEPLRWGARGDWSFNGRVTDF